MEWKELIPWPSVIVKYKNVATDLELSEFLTQTELKFSKLC